ncbi:ABC transporter substrate-binding protein [Streptomyces marispadix]|uniref:ABC transporter substrate-binding protein n=1 Tax=Streptomyces marispadix TaxID=2922868 RepID=A0ABS9T200_9ACTN|nr:ABC transporter substrate-binding protein [Streptomyces marispadix]MCH6162551.1 ABC transporter substrate-binding protein [Streptomyces marispadix]
MRKHTREGTPRCGTASRRVRGLRRSGLVLVTGLAVSLSACTGQGASGSSSDDEGSAGGKVTLTFWNGLTGGDRATIDKLIGEFNDSQKKVKVKSVPMPWDVFYQKLLTSVSSGNGPDIVAMDAGQMPKYADKGVLQPLDDFYSSKKHMDTSKLVPAAVNTSEFEGKNYGVPLNMATLMLFWNKTMFKDAGLDPEKPPKTCAEFAKMAPKLTKDTDGDGKPDQYAIALADHETIPMYPVLLWQGGADVVSRDGKKATLDDPKALKTLKYWVKQVRSEHISPVGLSGAKADKLFQTKKAAMEIVGPWVTTQFSEAGVKYGVTRPFSGPGGRQTFSSITSFGVSAKASPGKKNAAYRFFSFWNSKESQVKLAEGTGFPPDRTDVSPGDLKGNPDSAAFGAKDVTESARPYLPGLVNGPTIADQIFYPALQRALDGKQDVESVFKKADAQVQAQLDKQK